MFPLHIFRLVVSVGICHHSLIHGMVSSMHCLNMQRRVYMGMRQRMHSDEAQLGLYTSPVHNPHALTHSRVAGQTELYEASLQSLDRIARPIGGKFLLGCLWPLINAWSKDEDWRKRAGALCAIAQIAEGCRKALLPDAHLAALMGICCGAISDTHAFVKWSACQAIGQVCTGAALSIPF